MWQEDMAGLGFERGKHSNTGGNKNKPTQTRRTLLLFSFVWGIFWVNPWKSEVPKSPSELLCPVQSLHQIGFFFLCSCKEKSVSPGYPTSPHWNATHFQLSQRQGLLGYRSVAWPYKTSFLDTCTTALKFCCGLDCTGCLLVLIFSDAESKASPLQVPAILFNAFFEVHFPRCCRRDTSSGAQLGPSIVWPLSISISKGWTALPENTLASNLYSCKDQAKLLFIR